MLDWLRDKLFGRYEPTRQRLAVITEAIRCIDVIHSKEIRNDDREYFLCYRLNDACFELDYFDVETTIRHELKSFARSHYGELPIWWSTMPHHMYDERRALLVAFQARMQRRLDRCIKWGTK